MYIDSKFNVKGIGLVVSGTVRGNPIKINQKLLIGPFDDKFIPFKVRSLHNNVEESVNEIKDNDIGCIAIRFTGKESLTRNQIRKGSIIIDNEDLKKFICRKFKANITILNHSTTISNNYQPIIHCGLVRQAAKINILDNKNEKLNLRTGDKALVEFTFSFRSEYIEPDNIFFFRDGNTKGYGTVLEVY